MYSPLLNTVLCQEIQQDLLEKAMLEYCYVSKSVIKDGESMEKRRGRLREHWNKNINRVRAEI